MCFGFAVVWISSVLASILIFGGLTPHLQSFLLAAFRAILIHASSHLHVVGLGGLQTMGFASPELSSLALW